MFSGFKFFIPMLFITLGVLAVGVIPVFWGWFRIVGQWFIARQRVIPVALCALTMSVAAVLAGTVVLYHSLNKINGYQSNEPRTWWIFFAVGFALNVIALAFLRERNDEAYDSVLVGSIGVAAIHTLGLLWYWWGG